MATKNSKPLGGRPRTPEKIIDIEQRLDEVAALCFAHVPELANVNATDTWRAIAAILITDDAIFDRVRAWARNNTKSKRAGRKSKERSSASLKAVLRAWRAYKDADATRKKKSRRALIPGFKKTLAADMAWLRDREDRTVENIITQAEGLGRVRHSPGFRRYLRALNQGLQQSWRAARWAETAMRDGTLDEAGITEAASALEVAGFFGRRALAHWASQQKK